MNTFLTEPGHTVYFEILRMVVKLTMRARTRVCLLSTSKAHTCCPKATLLLVILVHSCSPIASKNLLLLGNYFTLYFNKSFLEVSGKLGEK
jgi:hypothetical protein